MNPTSTGKTTVRYYYHTNQLGSIIAISTSTGLVVQKYTYNAYGKPYIYSGSILTALSSYTGTLYGNTRLYTGREYDRETGYYYLRARTYSPDLGRFLSRDPVGQNDQVNLYTYVANSPLKYVDRMGKSAKAIIQIFKDSQRDMEDFRLKHQVNGYSNDLNLELNLFYFNQEFAGLGGKGTYDLAYGGMGIKDKYGFKNAEGKPTTTVLFDGEVMNLGEISNVLTALNASRLGFSQDHLEYWAMETVKLGTGNGVQGELADRKLYEYGYILGSIESKNATLTDQNIITAIKRATQSRKLYIDSNN